MSDRWWILKDGDGQIVGQVCHPDEPTSDLGGVDFVTAVEVDRRGDLALEVPEDGSWTPNIEVVRERRWVELRTIRNDLMAGGCATPLGAVDTRADSLIKINGSVSAAIIAKAADAPFSVSWTMADDSVVVHDADQMIAMGLAVMAHIQNCQNTGQSLRETLESYATTAEIEALEWPAP